MKRWWAFAGYALISAIHLVALFAGATVVSDATKWMLMPLLLAAFLITLPQRRSEVALWGTLAILFSWGGDVLLASPGDLGFLLGLGSFLVAHALYLVMFVRPLRVHRPPPLVLLYGAWWVALVVILGPHLGALFVPVAIYGLVLAAAAAFAWGTNRVTALGALVFVCSDTVLAFSMFWPHFGLVQANFVIMLTYIVGEGLIIAGAVLQVTSQRYTHPTTLAR